MDHGELEQLFRAFRDGGDVQRLGAVFDRAAPELLEIAVHLCGNVAEAEDLVQATFVVAIERASSWDPSQRLMPWLLGILARNAARARRDAAREPDAARLSERRATEPPEASSAAETRERLASAIAALPSPYREVLERHLLDDRRAVDVAREMSRAPGTVRMQILRGLQMLRRSLPPSVATGLLLADELRGLAAMRVAVLDKAALAAKSTVVGAVSGSSVIVGGALMSTKVVVSLALAASFVAGASWWLSQPTKRAAPPIEDAGATVPLSQNEVDAPTLAAPAARDTSDARQPASDLAAGRAGTPGIWLVGEVRGIPELHTLPTISVFTPGVDSQGASQPVPIDGHYQIDVTALFRVSERPLPGSLLVAVKHPLCETASATVAVDTSGLGDIARERTELRQDFDLVPRLGIAGRVVLPAGWSTPDTGVSLFRADDAGTPLGEAIDTIEPDAEGTYTFGLRKVGSYRVVATRRGLVPASCVVSMQSTLVAHAADLVLVPGPIAICGWVRWPLPIEVGGVGVVARRVGAGDDHHESLAWDGARFLALSQPALVDASGRFCIGGLAPGRYEVAIDGAPGIDHRVVLPSVEVIAPANDVVLGENVGRIAVDVLDDGVPLGNAKVQVVDEHGFWGATANASGHCAFLVNALRDCSVQASAEGYSTGSVALPAASRALDEHATIMIHRIPAEEATLELVPTPGDADNPSSVLVTFQAEDEAPLEWMMHSRGQPTAGLADGAYSLGSLKPGRYHVVIEPGESSHGFVPHGNYVRCDEFEIELQPGETLRRSIDFERGGRLRLLVEDFAGGEVEQTCEIVDADGQRVAVRFYTFSYQGDHLAMGSSTGATSLTEPAETYPNLAPGRYTVRLAVSGYRTIERDVLVRAGETADVHLSLERE